MIGTGFSRDSAVNGCTCKNSHAPVIPGNSAVVCADSDLIRLTVYKKLIVYTHMDFYYYGGYLGMCCHLLW